MKESGKWTEYNGQTTLNQVFSVESKTERGGRGEDT